VAYLLEEIKLRASPNDAFPAPPPLIFWTRAGSNIKLATDKKGESETGDVRKFTSARPVGEKDNLLSSLFASVVELVRSQPSDERPFARSLPAKAKVETSPMATAKGTGKVNCRIGVRSFSQSRCCGDG
jgi:hypothetical protein